MDSSSLIRPELLSLSGSQWNALAPCLICFLGGLTTLILSILTQAPMKTAVFFSTALTAILIGITSIIRLGEAPELVFNKMLILDSFSYVFFFILSIILLVTALNSFHYLERVKLQIPDYYVLLIFSVSGMLFMGSAQDLLLLFISLELMSIPLYFLIGFQRSNTLANEASLKYFILGGAASAFFLYGTALIYGVFGSTNFNEIWINAQAPHFQNGLVAVIGASFIMVGFLFKIGIFPFQFYLPETYEGSLAPITGFMATGVKTASFAALLRLLLGLKGVGDQQAEVHYFLELFLGLLATLAILTAFFGNSLALVQSNLKRLLAYSSIAHSGYLFLGLYASLQLGGDPSYLVFYLFCYVLTSLGAFTIFCTISQDSDNNLSLSQLAGLSNSRPFLAFCLSIFFLSMAGIPPTAGFIAKYSLFYNVVQTGNTPLVIIMLLVSMPAVYYYLKVIMSLYMEKEIFKSTDTKLPRGPLVTLIILLLLLLGVGFSPELYLQLSKRAFGVF